MIALFAVLAFGIIITLVYWYFKSNESFKDDARLFDLDRRQRDTESDYTSTGTRLERAFSRLGDLEDRVARLEDPYGKRKRGSDIYGIPYQGVPGLVALDGLESRPVQMADGTSVEDGLQPRRVHVHETDGSERYVFLGDDGELTVGKDNGNA